MTVEELIVESKKLTFKEGVELFDKVWMSNYEDESKTVNLVNQTEQASKNDDED